MRSSAGGRKNKGSGREIAGAFSNIHSPSRILCEGMGVAALNGFWTASFFGALSGVVGTGAGGLLACVLPAENKRLISFMLDYAAGLMLAIVCFDLIPNALRFTPLSAVLFGIFAGVFLMRLSESAIRAGKGGSGMESTGLTIALGIAVHGFLEGMAIGSGFAAEKSLGLSLTLAILLHDIPEGMSIAIPLRAGGAARTRALLLTLAAGLPMGFGAALGVWLGQRAALLIAVSLAIAGGAMLYLVFAKMLPESLRIHGGSSIGGILGLISGMLISFW